MDEYPEPVDAVLLCSEDDNVMINDYRIAFINKGAEDNIRSGNIYTIKRGKETESVYDIKTGLDIAPVASGRLIVLHTEKLKCDSHGALIDTGYTSRRHC